MRTALAAFALLAGPALLSAGAPAPHPDHGLSAVDRAAGWVEIDPATHLRAYKESSFPAKGWKVQDGILKSVAGGGPDLVTTAEFGDFELELDFRCTPKANSGIMFRVAEKHDATWQTGPEFQILDDATYGAKPTDAHSCGALYDLVSPPADKATNPAGEWNHARIRLRNGVLQHWLNGRMIVQTRTDTPEWTGKIAASKFKSYEGFGVLPRGRFALQHHGDEVWFRNIRARDLDAPMPGEVRLFNGADTTGWTSHLNDHGKMEDVWSVHDGVLVCKGTPAGYIRTTADFTNFVIRFQWRWSPETRKAGNSGFLARITGPDKVWPRCFEAQLMSGNAGDFYAIDGFPLVGDPARSKGRHVARAHTAERPVGEWNEYEIIAMGGDITLKVNGETVNTATGAQVIPGKIALQSEGAEIHFREIRLVPLAN